MVHHEPPSHELAAEKECAIEVCMEREAKRKKTYHAPKEIYSNALEGKAPTAPGMGQPYEPPLNPEVTIDMAQHTPQQAADRAPNLRNKICQKIYNAPVLYW
jgi:adenylylsulfate kinase